jgi:hypothetical protein
MNRWLYRINPGEDCSTVMDIRNVLLGVPILFRTFRNLLHLLPQVVSTYVILTGQRTNDPRDKLSIRYCSPNLRKLVDTIDHADTIINFEDVAKLL